MTSQACWLDCGPARKIVIEADNVPNVVVSRVDEHSVRLHPELIPKVEARPKRPGFNWEELKRDRDEVRP